ncbi:unnamed protein product [Brassicogethes aeneus]|uniref:Uncharacterized protein n=1 Tax=Brassicogethes aeneus TaxID=1431903 RepID=A0A9P0FJ65_BRAAE|nr:unnamed protein product [Brassicogethes aeneus]
MAYKTFYLAITLLGFATLTSTKPIMVTFGTNQGPIVPRQKSPSSLEPRNIVARSPAPVSEDNEDLPNPSVYKPLVPHQYRTKLLSVRVPPNLVLGTPLDQKYTPSLQKYNLQKKQQQGRSLGTDYTGPHIFEKQGYEFYENKPKTTLQPSVRYVKPQYFQQLQQNYDNPNNKYVPQIGIIYSGGVRYYVPQFVPLYQHQQQIQQQKDENSIYDHPNEKVYY